MASDTPETGSEENAGSENAEGENTSGDEEVKAAGSEDAESAPQYTPDELNKKAEVNAGPKADVNLDLVLDIPVNVSLRVGSTDISIRDLVRLVEGSVIALEQDANEPMDVLVNGTLIAHGEIVVVDDRYGVRLTDVVCPVERVENLSEADEAA